MDYLSLFKKAYDHFNEEVFTQEIYGFASKGLYKYHPYLGFTIRSMGGKYTPDKILTINSLGLRAVEEPDWNSYRICVIGGSVVFGSYAPSNDFTIPAYIERFFKNKKKEKKIQVINCGQGGHVMEQHLVLLHHSIIEKYKPDMVICLAGYNDFRNFIENKKPGSCRQNEFGKVIETIQRGSMTSVFKDVYLRTFRIRHRSFNKFLSKLYSKRLIFKRKNNIYSDNNKDLPLDPNEIGKCEKHASYFIQQLLYQKSLLNGLGIKFVASLQPALGYGDREITTEGEKYLIKKITNSNRGYLENLNTYYNAINKQMLEIKNDQDFQWLDCENAFNDVNRQIYIDPCHMGDVGNKIIAEDIFKKTNPTFNS